MGWNFGLLTGGTAVDQLTSNVFPRNNRFGNSCNESWKLKTVKNKREKMKRNLIFKQFELHVSNHLRVSGGIILMKDQETNDKKADPAWKCATDK